jgi:hypothetical protein
MASNPLLEFQDRPDSARVDLDQFCAKAEPTLELVRLIDKPGKS